MPINELTLTVFLLNLPFGYWRSKTVPFSAKWMLAIHIPVPFVIVLRIFSGLGWQAIPVLIAADIAGQLAGGMIPRIRGK